MTMDNQNGEWINGLQDLLDTHFPKLNENDVSKKSPNNRSAALVLHAETVIFVRDLLNAKDIEWVEEMIDFLDGIKPANKLIKDKIAQLRKTRDEYWEKNKVEIPDDVEEDDEGGGEIVE